MIKRFNEDRFNIKPEILCQLFMLGNGEAEGFEVVEDKIISSDPEDGGADHDYVLKEVSTGKFYAGSYSDWDIENTDYDEDDDECGDRVDFNCNLVEVFPEEVTTIVYKPRR